jgi:hypothetical protein
MASLGLAQWDKEQQAWLDSLPKLPFLASERLHLPHAAPAVSEATRAALAQLKSI